MKLHIKHSGTEVELEPLAGAWLWSVAPEGKPAERIGYLGQNAYDRTWYVPLDVDLAPLDIPEPGGSLEAACRQLVDWAARPAPGA